VRNTRDERLLSYLGEASLRRRSLIALVRRKESRKTMRTTGLPIATRSPIRFYQSLRFKTTIAVAVPLCLLLAGLSYMQYASHRDMLLEDLVYFAENANTIVRASLQQAMLTRNLAQAQGILDRIGQEQGVVNVLVLNKRGEVRVAPDGKDIGATLDQSDPNCQICHSLSPPARQGSTMATLPTGQRVFRSTATIDNAPECYRCHDPAVGINGIIITDLSLTEVDHHLAADLRNSVLWSLGAIVAVVIVVNAILSSMVLVPVERLAGAIRRLEAGELTDHLSMGGHDEVAEVSAAFDRMADGLQEKKRLELRVRDLLQGVLAAHDEERKHIARELHDELGQDLTALVMSLEATEEVLPESYRALRERVARTKSLTRKTLEETRRLILDLHPPVLDDLGLVPALRWYAEKRMEGQDVHVSLETTGQSRRLPDQVETTLFRIVQEAINNAAKHAHAHALHLSVGFEPACVRATVTDDGRGFNRSQATAPSGEVAGLGLLGMRERAFLLDGSVTIASEPGRGTIVQVKIPL
jgi:two-component system, NarL family, sensor histidine kinase UhpB